MLETRRRGVPNRLPPTAGLSGARTTRDLLRTSGSGKGADMRASLRAGAAIAALATIGAGAETARAQDTTEVLLEGDAVEIELSGRVQTQMATSSCSDFPFDAGSPCVDQLPAVDLFIRRARLAFDLRISELLDARIQPGFAGLDELEMKDAWGRLSFSPAFRLKIGHFKRPFDGFQLVSSTRILTIERDLDVPGVPGLDAPSLDELTTRFRLSDRDVGVMAHGAPEGSGLAYWLGTFNGRGPTDNEDLNGAKQLVGRLQYTFRPEGFLPVTLAGAAASTDLPVQGAGDQPGARASGERYANVELWAELGDFAPGPHLQAGLVLGDNPLQTPAGDPVDPDAATEDREFASATAWQVIGAYRLEVRDTDLLSAVEPVLRVTRSDPNTDVEDDEVRGVTPGVQLFFGGRNKVAVNWDLVSFADPATDGVSSFKVQFQTHFQGLGVR